MVTIITTTNQKSDSLFVLEAKHSKTHIFHITCFSQFSEIKFKISMAINFFRHIFKLQIIHYAKIISTQLYFLLFWIKLG